MLDAAGLVGFLQGMRESKKIFAELPEGSLQYSELWDGIRRGVAVLDDAGLGPGGRLLIVSQSDRHAILLFIAALLDGRCPVLVPPDTPAGRLEAIARKLRPQLVCVDRTLKLAMPWIGAWPSMALDAATGKGGGVLAKLLGAGKAPSDGFPANLASVQPRDPTPPADGATLAFIAFTSGTTAAPKGVMISHRALFEHLDTLVRQFDYDADSRILNNMVLSHNDGLVQGPLVTLACGGTLLRPHPLDARNVGPLLDDVYAAKATHFLTVPTILALAVNRAEHEDYFKGPEFRHLVSVAGKLDATTWARFEQRFGVRVSNLYGLTETVAGGVFAGPDEASHAIGTVGLPVDMEAKIVDASGAELSPGSTGELWLRGGNLFDGYLDDAAATAEIFHGDWLRTGDLARMREDGKIEICGRIKALVVTGGLSVHPDEIDEVLLSHPGVMEAASLGLPHAEWGEVLVSAVVLRPEQSAAGLLDYCRERLEPKKLPTRILAVDSLPRGRSGKVDRNALARLVDEHIASATTVPGEGPIAGRLLQLAGSIFNRDAGTLSFHDTPDTINAWDSLNHLQLVSAAEAAFQVELEMMDVMRVQSLGDLLDVIERKRQTA